MFQLCFGSSFTSFFCSSACPHTAAHNGCFLLDRVTGMLSSTSPVFRVDLPLPVHSRSSAHLISKIDVRVFFYLQFAQCGQAAA